MDLLITLPIYLPGHLITPSYLRWPLTNVLKYKLSYLMLRNSGIYLIYTFQEIKCNTMCIILRSTYFWTKGVSSLHVSCCKITKLLSLDKTATWKTNDLFELNTPLQKLAHLRIWQIYLYETFHSFLSWKGLELLSLLVETDRREILESDPSARDLIYSSHSSLGMKMTSSSCYFGVFPWICTCYIHPVGLNSSNELLTLICYLSFSKTKDYWYKYTAIRCHNLSCFGFSSAVQSKF